MHPSRRRLLVIAFAVHLLMTGFLASDGVDRLRGVPGPVDLSALLLAPLLGWPALLALLLTLLPGRGPRRAALVLGVVGVLIAVALLPLYGLGMLVLPGALVGLWAGLVEDETGRACRCCSSRSR